MWKDIEGYDGRYQVSIDGSVRSVDWLVVNANGVKHIFRGRTLKPCLNAIGYYVVNLTKNGVSSPVLLHRIIAKAFIANPNGYNEVNHINENRSDNSIDNLEWCTHLHNVRHGTAIQRATKKKINNASFSNRVAQYSKNGEFIAEYPSAKEASRVTGAPYVPIVKCCHGIKKTSGGYKWKYITIAKRNQDKMNNNKSILSNF